MQADEGSFAKGKGDRVSVGLERQPALRDSGERAVGGWRHPQRRSRAPIVDAGLDIVWNLGDEVCIQLEYDGALAADLRAHTRRWGENPATDQPHDETRGPESTEHGAQGSRDATVLA